MASEETPAPTGGQRDSGSGTGAMRLLLTVDVEAAPERQAQDHVDRLVWGRFGDQEVGIGRMMEIAERYGHRLTFFVDFCEAFLYPGAMEAAAECILRRGHDVQLHAHTVFLPGEFWKQQGLRPYNTSLSGYDREHSNLLVRFLLEKAAQGGVTRPVAFRGGAFRYNHEVLRAMAAHGLTVSSNYNVKSDHQPNNSENLSAFRWDNGVLELPIGNLFFENFLRSFELNLMNFSDQRMIHGYMREYFATLGSDAVLTLLMHSWSFCEKDEATGHFTYRNDRLSSSFEAFLQGLPEGYRSVTANELDQEVKAGRLAPALTRPVELLDRNRYPARDQLAPVPSQKTSAPPAEPCCNFCGTPAGKMVDFGGRPRVRCPTCLSLERTRIFRDAYQRFIRHEFDLAGKKVLLVSPSDAVLAFLKPLARLTTCDIRPAGMDLQLDICHMPQVQSESFDAVIAKGVLQHCHDDEAALDEFLRVLKPWGRVFLQVGTRLGAETEVISDVTRVYGKEMLEQYKVGSFRTYGDLSLLRTLQRRFLVKTFHGTDSITGKCDAIYCGIKEAAGK